MNRKIEVNDWMEEDAAVAALIPEAEPVEWDEPEKEKEGFWICVDDFAEARQIRVFVKTPTPDEGVALAEAAYQRGKDELARLLKKLADNHPDNLGEDGMPTEEGMKQATRWIHEVFVLVDVLYPQNEETDPDWKEKMIAKDLADNEGVIIPDAWTGQMPDEDEGEL